MTCFYYVCYIFIHLCVLNVVALQSTPTCSQLRDVAQACMMCALIQCSPDVDCDCV